jgi:aryl-alcohol dehydrogenase-like predicted oxidoreductase
MTHVPQVQLAPGYTVPRLIKGGWQLAGGHGPVDAARSLDDMHAFVRAGITAFDCADIYTGVEEQIGIFLASQRTRGDDTLVRVHTKCVPDRDLLPTLTHRDLERTIDRSLTRLGVEQLDLVQLHWWDLEIPGIRDAARALHRMQRDGKINQLGATNCDTPTLRALLDDGIPIVAHQVQVSLLDARTSGEMSALCLERGVSLLAYGSLAGGFFNERWLGQPEPREPLENRSLVKYKLIIDDFGGWDLFQSLLRVLQAIASAHQSTIGAVAIHSVLAQPSVAAAIVGARSTAHLDATLNALTLALDEDEWRRINDVLSQSPGLSGDVYALERDKTGRHAAIMRYNLNKS